MERGKNFSGQKINFFSRQLIPAINYNDIILAVVRNLHILARNYTFWQEFVVFGETRLALARKNLTIFLAETSWREKFRIFFATEIEKPLGLSTYHKQTKKSVLITAPL